MAAILPQSQCVNSQDADTRIFRDRYVDNIATHHVSFGHKAINNHGIEYAL